MVVYIGGGLPLAFKSVGQINGVLAFNPFTYGAEAGDLAIIVAAGDQAFTALAGAQPIPTGWTQPGYLVGGHTGISGGGGEVNFIFKRLTAADDVSVTVLAPVVVPIAWLLLYTGGRRPPATHAGFIQQGMFVGGVPGIVVTSASSHPPSIVINGGISDHGAGGQSPGGLTQLSVGLSMSTAWMHYGTFAETALPFSHSFSCPSGTNFAGHAGFYIEA